MYFGNKLHHFQHKCTNTQTGIGFNKARSQCQSNALRIDEEINHSYDGGLYAELIRNRIFKDNPTKPEAWSLVNEDTVKTKATMKLIAATQDNVPFDERRHAINGALQTCLRLTVEKANGKVGVANEGYWGIPVKPSTTYKASFYLKGTGSIWVIRLCR